MSRTTRTALLPLLALALLLVAAGDSEEPAAFELFMLGTVQDGGLPHLGCDRECCVGARERGEMRYPACLGIHNRRTDELLLIEATPAVEAQVSLLQKMSGVSGRGRAPVDALVLTHAHIGHYLGLAQLGREVANTRDLPVHTSPRMASFLKENGPWSLLVDLGQIRLVPFTPGESFEIWDGLSIEPVAVPHRDEFSDTMALRIHGPRRTVLFAPDVDSWDRHPGLLESLLDGVDVAYVDGTFYDGRELPDRNLTEIPHPMMIDTMSRLGSRAQAAPGSVRFLHMNHTNPALIDPVVLSDLEQRGFRLAHRGEALEL